MKIPEFDLEFEVLDCVCVVDRELEIVSQAFLEELKKRTHIEYSRVHIALPDFATRGAIIAYYDAFEENEFDCLKVEFTQYELSVLYRMED